MEERVELGRSGWVVLGGGKVGKVVEEVGGCGCGCGWIMVGLGWLGAGWLVGVVVVLGWSKEGAVLGWFPCWWCCGSRGCEEEAC